MVWPHAASVLNSLFPRKSVKKRVRSPASNFYSQKLTKVTKKVPKWSQGGPKEVPKSSFCWFLNTLFFHFGTLWTSLASLVAKMAAQDAKMEPRMSQKSDFATPVLPKRILAVYLSGSFYISFLYSFPSSFSSCCSFSFCLSCSFSFSLSIFISLSLSRSFPSSLSYFSVVLL